MKVSKNKKEEIFDMLGTYRFELVFAKGRWKGEADRELQKIRTNANEITGISDFFITIAHEVAHIVFDIDDEEKADEIAIELANKDWFREAVALYHRNVYSAVRSIFENG